MGVWIGVDNAFVSTSGWERDYKREREREREYILQIKIIIRFCCSYQP
jgi:hypothetical protein